MLTGKKKTIIKHYLVNKQGGKCYYCNKKLQELSLDHKQPRSKGGTDHISNLAITCYYCNNTKGNMTENEFKAFIIQTRITSLSQTTDEEVL